MSFETVHPKMVSYQFKVTSMAESSQLKYTYTFRIDVDYATVQQTGQLWDQHDQKGKDKPNKMNY